MSSLTLEDRPDPTFEECFEGQLELIYSSSEAKP